MATHPSIRNFRLFDGPFAKCTKGFTSCFLMTAIVYGEEFGVSMIDNSYTADDSIDSNCSPTYLHVQLN